MKRKTGLLTVFIGFLIALFAVAFETGSVQANNSTKLNYDFESITDEESISFVKQYNIDVPETLLKTKEMGAITKSIIKSIYNDPEVVFAYNYIKLREYAESIRQVMTEKYVCKKTDSKPQYALQYNTVRNANGNWVTSGGYYDIRWENFNCYAFAIHRMEQPAFYYSDGQYQPGDMADYVSSPNAINTFGDCSSIDDLATLVGRDITAMGYSNIMISDSLLPVSSSQELICVRMKTVYNSNIDFHFMYFDKATGAWYHKPGETAVLKYNDTPNNANNWKREISYHGEERLLNDFEYDSDIRFIRYNKNKVVFSNGTLNHSYSLQVEKGNDSILEIENTSSRLYRFVLSAGYSINARLYNSEMELINTYSGSSIAFNYSLSSGTYYLALNYSNANVYGSVSINISAHYHNYGAPYQWKNYSQHYATCECGLTTLKPHAISSGSYSPGQQYATCLLCGGLASVGIVNRGASADSLPSTPNGSFKLPNGVVVLVDADIEAFFNDMLVFTEPDKSISKNVITQYSIYEFRKKVDLVHSIARFQ